MAFISVAFYELPQLW